ncbi:MAG: hypothetical protein ACRCZK_06740, partial [Oscillospiraceae bacterium]
LLNKQVIFKDLFEIILNTMKDIKTTTFDEFGNWMNRFKFGKDEVLKRYKRPVNNPQKTNFDRNSTKENVEQNLISTAKLNPDIQFYYVFPPISIIAFDNFNQQNKLEAYFQSFEYATELMLEVDNIKITSYLNQYDVIENLKIYKDSVHYDEDTNSQILIDIYNNKNRLTKDNYKQHFKELSEYFLNYDYDSLFK